ncbi:plexin-B isoform X4 [Cloeon dipterum]|uniref:plexin-B isoform X4 n=1 Tax=Cloeon dipterum TaxID=197152 RepID=UPI0032207ACA
MAARRLSRPASAPPPPRLLLVLGFLLTTWWPPTVGDPGAVTTPPPNLPPPPPVIHGQYPPTDAPAAHFTHMLVHRSTGKVLVAGTNLLVQLDAGLKEEKLVKTGPQPDSPDCSASGCSEEAPTTMTNNVNKVLVLDYERNNLIVCGSVRQGACSKYLASNLSIAPEFVAKSVAANDATSSTFAFIGPAKYTDFNSVLYVGATNTNSGLYRYDMPAIASRSLEDLNVVEMSLKRASLLINDNSRDHFLVKYVYGFNDTEYAYFVIMQKNKHLQGEEHGYETRLARICIKDSNYETYTEVTLQCVSQDKGINYTLVQDAKLTQAGPDLANDFDLDVNTRVLVAVFGASKGSSDEPINKSAMCVYTMRDIDAMFNTNIHLCLNGTVKSRNMHHISGPVFNGDCNENVQSAGNIGNFCDVGLKISGTHPIVNRAVIEFDGTYLTSVTTATVGTHSVAFLGTKNGRLKKVFLVDKDVAHEYEEIILDPGNAILPDTSLDRSGDFLYVLTTSKILKVKVEDCTNYSNCSSCMEARDPYCGWCSLEKRCTVRGECQKADHSSPRWLTFGSVQQCIDFEQVLPDRIPINQMTDVQLKIRTLPTLHSGAKYRCVFGEADPIDADVLPNGLKCRSPPLHKRPKIPEEEDHVLVLLSVRSSETNKDFVSRNFAYYDCSRHTTCRECVTSKWACNWCVYENKCTHNTTSCQRAVVSGENNPTQLASQGAKSCPRFVNLDDSILLPNNVQNEIRLQVDNLPYIQAEHSGFQCIITIEGAKMKVPTKVEQGGIVYCEKTTYSYEANTGEYQASLTLVWNNNHFVDTTNITLYKCEILGSHKEHPDCSLCVTRNAKYECSWCGNKCSYSKSCQQTPANKCPKPRIDVVKPLGGPIEGGTLVTIIGGNLGLKREDVSGKISIGDIPCELVNFEVSLRIECRTGASINGEMTAPVIVWNDAGSAESPVGFSYKNIVLEGLYPPIGPESGGTQLAITGHNLNTGSTVHASLDELPCLVNMTQASSSRITCITSKANNPRQINRLTLSIDGANRTLEGNCFNYTKDPTIMEIKPLKSFASGGRMITVHGTDLDSIQKPEMVVYSDNEPINKTICNVLNDALMECPSPPINLEFLTASRQKRSRHQRSLSKFREVSYQIGFVMDNVEKVRDMGKYFEHISSQLTYVEDPKIFQFPNYKKSYKGDTLVIEGENLNLASEEYDVNVTIGTRPCNVTSLANTQLVCTPPDMQPHGTDEFGIQTDSSLPLVVVKVGQSLRFPVGYLQYDVMKLQYYADEAIFGIAAGSVLLIILFAAVLVVYRRKSTQAEREYKRIQIQMDTLESNVRSECKQAFTQMCTWDPRRNGGSYLHAACWTNNRLLCTTLLSHQRAATLLLAFAELQTDMTDLTADLETSGIPTLDHKSYIMKVFFPGVNDHPILNDPKHLPPQVKISAPRTNYDAAMLQFEQLISNKNFLLTFIDTLESQKSFNIRDKVNVASLLMVVLMGKMEYATEILRCLLLRLIDKSVGTKHPQLMLRRTESVVEKMLTNWMALCMYNYLKEYSGSSLFLLFKAIKYQIEKGPVDAITHDARYSLSEERLLREQIDHGFVTIHLVQEDPHYEKIPYHQRYQTLHVVQEDVDEKIQCKVLDCDTISQVKLKILDALYKNTPYSMRPSIHEIDLEWRHGRGGHLTLQDEDLTTKTVGGWKKINTLFHYGVKESAVMSLIPRQNDAFNSNCKQPCQNCTGSSYFTNTLSPIITNNGDIESGHSGSAKHASFQVYHLLRQVDENHYQNNKNASERTHKAIPEIFLTRLLSTKGTIQKFVDDFFNTILAANESLPPAIKWLFDLLDEAARRHGITDPEVVHAWKSNSLPLRFWVNFIKNPDFIFDVNKTTTVDCCLSVIAQTLMDSCSTSEHRLGKDSPSNKLLFAKDIPNYREMVSHFYCDIQMLPQITDQEMSTAMQQLSVSQIGEFDVVAALKELYIYVNKYSEQIFDSLETDPYCKKMHLAHKLENVACTLEGEETSTC